jgi:hypothetical protein
MRAAAGVQRDTSAHFLVRICRESRRGLRAVAVARAGPRGFLPRGDLFLLSPHTRHLLGVKGAERNQGWKLSHLPERGLRGILLLPSPRADADHLGSLPRGFRPLRGTTPPRVTGGDVSTVGGRVLPWSFLSQLLRRGDTRFLSRSAEGRPKFPAPQAAGPPRRFPPRTGPPRACERPPARAVAAPARSPARGRARRTDTRGVRFALKSTSRPAARARHQALAGGRGGRGLLSAQTLPARAAGRGRALFTGCQGNGPARTAGGRSRAGRERACVRLAWADPFAAPAGRSPRVVAPLAADAGPQLRAGASGWDPTGRRTQGRGRY